MAIHTAIVMSKGPLYSKSDKNIGFYGFKRDGFMKCSPNMGGTKIRVYGANKNSQEWPKGACVLRGLWTMTAFAKSASSKLWLSSLSSRNGRDVVRMNWASVVWACSTKCCTSLILEQLQKGQHECIFSGSFAATS